MMSLLYAILVPAAPPQEALDRYAALRKQGPAVEMTFKTGNLTGDLLIHPGNRMRLEAKAEDLNYLCVITSAGMKELDRIERQYDSLAVVDKPTAPPSRMSGIGRAFPGWVFVTDLRKIHPAIKFTGLGPRTVDGIRGSAVQGTFEQNGGKHTVEVTIDDAGIPRRYLSHGETPMGSYRMEWTITKFKVLGPPPASRFAFQIPDGYTPFSLDTVQGPIGVGSKLPLAGWRTPAGGSLNLASRLGKGGLVAVWGTDCEPSRRSASALAKIRAAGVPVVVLSDAANARDAKGVDGFDPSGKVLEELSAPATPAFFRVDGSGKVTAVWLGYDSAKSAEFVREATAK